MRTAAETFGAAQLARAASLPSQLDAPTPAREALLEGPRQRNALLDALFYDLKVVDPEEASRIAPRWAAEGAILVVPPSGRGPLALYLSIDDLVAHGTAVSSLAVAGVGSSALGTAAFARNVADAIQQPVAAVVSGYGLADVAAEALGGFFWFGALNGIRHHFEALDRMSAPQIVKDANAASIGTIGSALRLQSRDTQTALALLQDARLNFQLLVGHSKGNLVISEALYGLVERDRARAAELGRSATVVTISAKIAMPPAFQRVIDIMGAWDWFGALNSRRDIPADHVIPNAWHHTNTDLPAHLPVTKALRGALAPN